MDNVSMRPKGKILAQQQAMQNDRFDSISAEELLELFPLPRYFQIHFSHVHENCEHAKQQLDELMQSVERLEQKLDRLLSALV